MKDTVDPQIAKQIRALDMKYDEAFNKNDAAAVAARFTEDGVQVAPEGVFFGRQAIEKRYAEQVFQQWHCNNHITKTKQVIAVGNKYVRSENGVVMPEIATVVPNKSTATYQRFLVVTAILGRPA